MSLRTVADETPRLCLSTSDFEPIGSLVETKSATIARSTSKRRSSALPIRIHLPNLVQFTVITRNYRFSHALADGGARIVAALACPAWPCRGATRRRQAADDLQRRARGQAVPREWPVLPGLVTDPATSDPARRTGHHHDSAGAGPPAVRRLHVLRRPFPPRGGVEGHYLPRRRFASRGAGGTAKSRRAACATTRSGRGHPADPAGLALGHVFASAGVELAETVALALRRTAMPRVTGVSDRDAGLGAKIAYFFTKRRFKQMTGLETATMLEPLRMYAYIPKLLNAYGRLEMAESKMDILSPRHRALAELKSAMTVRCEYCIDLGSAIARGWGLTDEELLALSDYPNATCFSDLDKLILDYATAVSRTPVEVSDELFDRLRMHFDNAQVVGLTHVITLGNLRGRFNLALGIGASGFSEGKVCALPDTGRR